MTTNPAVPLARSSGCSRITAIAVFVLLAGIVFLFPFLAWYLSAGPFDAARMNGIVEAVRRQQVGEEQVEFRIEDLSRPESLHPLQQPLQAWPNVWARKINGALQVAIMTRDRGHIGEYGFVFSEVPVTVTDVMEESIYYNIPGPMMELDGKIDEHWWKVANRSR